MAERMRTRRIDGIPALIGKVSTDKKLRKEFMENPAGVAKQFNLSRDEVASLEALDREGLVSALSGFDALELDPLVAGHSSMHSSVTD